MDTRYIRKLAKRVDKSSRRMSDWGKPHYGQSAERLFHYLIELNELLEDLLKGLDEHFDDLDPSGWSVDDVDELADELENATKRIGDALDDVEWGVRRRR